MSQKLKASLLAEIDRYVKTVSQLRGWIFIAAVPAEIIGDLVTCVKQISIAAFDLTTLDALIISQSRNLRSAF